MAILFSLDTIPLTVYIENIQFYQFGGIIIVNILIDNKSGTPIYDQIYSQIKSQIISGSL